VDTKKGRANPPPPFCCRFRIQDGQWSGSGIRDKHPGSTTLRNRKTFSFHVSDKIIVTLSTVNAFRNIKSRFNGCAPRRRRQLARQTDQRWKERHYAEWGPYGPSVLPEELTHCCLSLVCPSVFFLENNNKSPVLRLLLSVIHPPPLRFV
jgi:hypothetical protein